MLLSASGYNFAKKTLCALGLSVENHAWKSVVLSAAAGHPPNVCCHGSPKGKLSALRNYFLPQKEQFLGVYEISRLYSAEIHAAGKAAGIPLSNINTRVELA